MLVKQNKNLGFIYFFLAAGAGAALGLGGAFSSSILISSNFKKIRELSSILSAIAASGDIFTPLSSSTEDQFPESSQLFLSYL